VDSFDIEINENDPQKFIDIVVSMEPTFGGINLEDIKVKIYINYIKADIRLRENDIKRE
jgi:malate dehydrogenase (oxaloacetate-decarboxylating)(NADP+)